MDGSELGQDFPLRLLHVLGEINLGPGQPPNDLVSDLDVAEKSDQRVFVFHLPSLTIDECSEGGHDMGSVRVANLQKSDALTGMVVPRRHLLGKRNHAPSFSNDHAFLAALLDR